MHRKELVSIIIPIYNVENYIKRCIDSVLKQTYQNLEIILVDDGSPDKCPKICDEYRERDSRVIVIHKENGGLASARNSGMKIAQGDYLLFVDSDDWINENMVEDLLKIAIENDVDFVRFVPVTAGYPDIPDGTPINFGTEDFMETGIYNKERIKTDIYPRLFVTPQLTMGPIVAAWRSLYKTNFLKENNFYFYEEVKYSEDAIFSARVVYGSTKFYYLKGGYYYNYFYNESSITKSFRKDRFEVCKILSNAFKEDFNDKEDYDFSNQIRLQCIYNVLTTLAQSKYLTNINDRYGYVKSIFDDEFTKECIKHHRLAKVSWKLKLVIFMIKYKMAFLYTILI